MAKKNLDLHAEWMRYVFATQVVQHLFADSSESPLPRVISDRISGSGPYHQRYLKGLDYILNGKDLLPHPNLTLWLDREIQEWMEEVLKGEKIQPSAAIGIGMD